MFILLIYHGYICTCLNFVESTFCSGIVEKLCPLKIIRRNYHDDLKNGIYPSRFYNINSYDRTEWKCHTAWWIFGKIIKWKINNIYWKLCQSFKSVNSIRMELWKSCFKQKCCIRSRNCNKTNAIQMKNLSRINTNFQSCGSKVPLWNLIPLIRYTRVRRLIKYTYVYWSCVALNLIC